MAFSFGAEDGGFDWGSLLSNVITTAGQVTTAVVTGTQTPKTPAVAGSNVITSQPLTTTTARPTSNLLLLGLAAALGLVLFMRMKRR